MENRNNASEDFESFLKGFESPPREVSEKTKASNFELLKKEKHVLWTKIISIRAFSGALTLLFCPQFGWNPFSASTEVTHAFMSYGAWACGLFCGAIFMGTGSLIEPLVLSRANLQIAKDRFFTRSAIICSLFFVTLMALGDGRDAGSMFISASFIIAWFIGALSLDGLAHMGLRRLRA